MDEDTEVVLLTSLQQNQAQADSKQTPLIPSEQAIPPDQGWGHQHNNAQDQVTRMERVSRPRLQFVLRPVAKCSINDIPKRTFA